MARVRFHQYAWALLAYNLAVVLGGAFVRASMSGDGCGNHWPVCNGELLPDFTRPTKALIEWSHRASTGLLLPLILGLLVWAFRSYPKGHPVRSAAVTALLMTVVEALIGAALVVFGWVANDRSVYRAIVMPAHLIATFLLLGSLTLTAWWSSGGRPLRLRGQGAMAGVMGLALGGVLLLGVSGAITALGDTLFPAASLSEGLRQEFSPSAHFLLSLRIYHPLIAMCAGLFLLLTAGLAMRLRLDPSVERAARALVMLFLIQMGAGLINLGLLAPIWMQLVHLLLADLVWIALVILAACALAEGVPQAALEPPLGVRRSASGAGVRGGEAGVALSGGVVASPALTPWPPLPKSGRRGTGAGTLASSPSPSIGSGVGGEGSHGDHASLPRATWRDYLALTKPRVISLLLFTTVTAMMIAAGSGDGPGFGVYLAVAVGFYMAAGAANAINMVLERDLDLRMGRTARRPTVTQAIPAREALLFALALMVGSVVLLWWAANLLSAMLAMAGLAFYVVVYTVLLKRRTWANIVIGGAAGAFPPLVGWAAVTGDLSPLAWCLFGIIFLWTPVHFWALAILIKEDYARAGVPMLPVVRGERATVIQIAWYAVLTVVISTLPFVLRGEDGGAAVGWLYLAAAALLNIVLLQRSLQLYRRPDHPRARSLFKYSMVYLALLFLAMAVDRAYY